jgi:probable HAF family extracellular repeat protein
MGRFIALFICLASAPAFAAFTEPAYREDFGDGVANGWTSLSGTWSAASKVYTSSAVVQTAMTQSPLGRPASELPYTFKVRMFNPYGGSANLLGVAWVRDVNNYTEAVFSPTGEARLNKVASGVRTTLASASYLGGSRATWFEVEVGNDAKNPQQLAYIKVNGVPVFDVAPSVREGTLSLITHWTPGQFDNVRAAAHFLNPVSENFDDGTAPQFAAGGTWSVQNDTLTSTAVVAASRALMKASAGWHELADIEFRARMLNRFTTSGNLVGFTYGARGDTYYEAVFSPTGVAQLRKVVKNVPTLLATGHHEGGGRNQWFDAQLIQLGQRTTVKVNGFAVFQDVLQPEAVGGDLGFVTHWTSASVDDVSLAQIPVTRYRFTQLPSLPSPVPSSGARALNDLGEVVGQSRITRTNGNKTTAVLWRNGSVIDLHAVAGDGSAANDINNKSEIVGDYFGLFGFAWKNGQLRSLHPFPGALFDRAEAKSINERGQIAGASCAGVDACPAQVWEPDGRITKLEDLPGGINWATAWAINAGGEIVGEADGGGPLALAPVSWQNGTVEPLGISGGAMAINNRGQIVGFTRRAPDTALPATWQNHEPTLLPARPRQIYGVALAINEHAMIVGWTDIETPNPSLGLGTAATLWQECAILNLNELLACGPLPDPLFLTAAPDVNERGQIVANAFDATIFEPVGYLLTPVLGEESCNR